MGYYLADDIYPTWFTFVKTIKRSVINTAKQSHFVTIHEAQRKDVERAFGVLQKRFGIIRGLVLETGDPIADNDMLHHFASHDH